MRVKRHKLEEIVTKLRQVKVLCGQGMPRVDVIRQMQKMEQTFYRCRKRYKVGNIFAHLKKAATFCDTPQHMPQEFSIVIDT